MGEVHPLAVLCQRPPRQVHQSFLVSGIQADRLPLPVRRDNRDLVRPQDVNILHVVGREER